LRGSVPTHTRLRVSRLSSGLRPLSEGLLKPTPQFICLTLRKLAEVLFKLSLHFIPRAFHLKLVHRHIDRMGKIDAHSAQSRGSRSSLSSGAEFAPNWESALNIICEEREEGWQITVDAPELARVLPRFGLCDEAALNNAQQELPNPRN
jgi:hypothetical protein